MPKPKKDTSPIERAPIIAVMGHIDHGKSTLLDYLRKTNVVEGESGGITQHLSAYQLSHKNKEGNEKAITFLDTPGHAAFSAMRLRGATLADIVILVVSAEDGVQEQTKEALAQIKEAGTPYVIAITKTDKPNANVERTKQSLLENEIYIEGYGGDIPAVAISSKTGDGMDELLDMILLVAELQELTGNPGKPAEGVIIESDVDPRKGTSATLMILDGTLHKGEFVVAEDVYSPIRTLQDFTGKDIPEAGPSTPVRITGFSGVPKTGAPFTTAPKKKEAEKTATANALRNAETHQVEHTQKDKEKLEVPVILKSDVVGTLEAVEQAVRELAFDHAYINVVHTGVGNISENDIKSLAGTQRPILIGFHVGTDRNVDQLAERIDAEIHTFEIIYKITEWLSEEVERRVPEEMREETQGKAEIVRVFSTEKQKQIIGGKVTEGVLRNNAEFKIYRRGNQIGKGKVMELQSQKAKVDEVAEGNEFGMMIESKMDVARGDTIEPFVIT